MICGKIKKNPKKKIWCAMAFYFVQSHFRWILDLNPGNHEVRGICGFVPSHYSIVETMGIFYRFCGRERCLELLDIPAPANRTPEASDFCIAVMIGRITVHVYLESIEKFDSYDLSPELLPVLAAMRRINLCQHPTAQHCRAVRKFAHVFREFFFTRMHSTHIGLDCKLHGEAVFVRNAARYILEHCRGVLVQVGLAHLLASNCGG